MNFTLSSIEAAVCKVDGGNVVDGWNLPALSLSQINLTNGWKF